MINILFFQMPFIFTFSLPDSNNAHECTMRFVCNKSQIQAAFILAVAVTQFLFFRRSSNFGNSSSRIRVHTTIFQYLIIISYQCVHPKIDKTFNIVNIANKNTILRNDALLLLFLNRLIKLKGSWVKRTQINDDGNVAKH